MHLFKISTLSESNQDRIKTLLESLAGKLIEAPKWKIVRVHSGQALRWRRAPGANKLLEKLGPEAFDLFGALLSVGLSAYADSKRDDLTPSARIGRSFLDVLVSVSPLGPLALGASIIFPEKSDSIKSWLFMSTSPHVNYFSDLILRVGGERFQEWSTKPSWLDFV